MSFSQIGKQFSFFYYYHYSIIRCFIWVVTIDVFYDGFEVWLIMYGFGGMVVLVILWKQDVYERFCECIASSSFN